MEGDGIVPVVGAISRLKSSLDHLKPSEKRVASWILENPVHASSLTVRELAKLSKSSQSTVIRLCHTLQFKSYLDLKLSVVADLSSQSERQVAFAEITPGSPFHAVMGELQQSLTSSIQRTLSGLTEEALKTVSALIHQNGRILAFGCGASAVVAKDIQQKFQRLGCNIWAVEDFHTAATMTAQFGPHDLLLAVSYSGHTSDVLEVAKIARQRGANIVVITQYGVSHLQNLATVVLPVAASEVPIRVGASGSLLGSLAVVSSVLVYYVNRYPETSAASLSTTRASVASHLQ